MLLNIKEAFSGQAYYCLKFRWCFIKFSRGKITPSIIQICFWMLCNTSSCVWNWINQQSFVKFIFFMRSDLRTYVFQWRLSYLLFPSEHLENVLTIAFELKGSNDCWTVSSWIFLLEKYTEKVPQKLRRYWKK